MTMLLESFSAMYNDDIVTKVMDGIGDLGKIAIWDKYVNIFEEKKLVVNTTAYTGFGTVGEWKDGEPLPMDHAELLYNSTLTMVRYGMGFKVSRAMQDYGEVRIINRWALSLIKSTHQCYEANHATLLNGSFTTTWSSMGNQPLISENHTTAGSETRSNKLVPAAALSPSSLATLKTRARNWINYKGLNDPISYVGMKLITPPDLDDTAQKLIGSNQEPFTTDNDINTNKGLFRHISNPWLTSTTAWWLQGDEHGLVANHGMRPSPINFGEESTESAVIGVKFDFIPGIEFPDGMFGSEGV